MTSLTDLRSIRIDLLTVLERVDRLIGELQTGKEAPPIAVAELDRTKAIEWLLEQSGQALRPVEIWAQLHRRGRDDPKMEVQVTTFDLWRRQRVGRIGRGQHITNAQQRPCVVPMPGQALPQ